MKRKSMFHEGVLGGVAKFTNEFTRYKVMMKPMDFDGNVQEQEGKPSLAIPE